MERAAAARILAHREIEMERVSESESEYVPRRRRMARMDGGEMRMRIERLICLVEICHVGVRARRSARKLDRNLRAYKRRSVTSVVRST